MKNIFDLDEALEAMRYATVRTVNLSKRYEKLSRYPTDQTVKES